MSPSWLLYYGTVNLRVSHSLDGRLSLKHNHTVGQVSSHDEIVLYHEGRLLGMKNKPR